VWGVGVGGFGYGQKENPPILSGGGLFAVSLLYFASIFSSVGTAISP
jgi:hypothetical protein